MNALAALKVTIDVGS